MISAAEAVFWINRKTHEVMVRPHAWGCPEDRLCRGNGWCDPIGAAYRQWQEMKPAMRVQLMLETVIDLAMQGFAVADVLRAFAQVHEFRALGRVSHPMCRALTSALVGQCLEANTMTFDELLVAYAPK